LIICNERTGQALSLQLVKKNFLGNVGDGLARPENVTASFMMFCLKSIVVYGNADLESGNNLSFSFYYSFAKNVLFIK